MPVHRRVRSGLSRSFQIISLFQNLTAFETVRIAVQAQSSQRFGFFRNALELAEVSETAWSILAAIRLDRKAGEVCSNLSHGDQRLLDLALVLASGGDLLLLDEPLAGLSEADRRVVSEVIVDLAKTHAVLMVEHDIDRVMSLSDRITVLHQGKLIADGLPREVANDPAVVAAYIGKSDTDEDIEKVLAPAAGVPRAPSQPLLILENVRGGYEGSTVLEAINLTVASGEVVALLGRNGVGKTTTLRAICGVVKAQFGRIVFDGKDIATLPTYAINRLGIGLVPEGRRVFPNLTVAENLKIASRPGGISLSQAYDIFPKLKILQNSRASNLSGGERQMLAIARVLMFPTKLILLDEPFEGLSPAIVKEVMKAVAGLRERSSVIIVEHNAELVLPFVDRVYVLVNGRVAYEGLAAELAMDEPLQARLLGVTHGEVHEPAV
jgi:ABC-type branched-subunit amino acid transport system ATPase component